MKKGLIIASGDIKDLDLLKREIFKHEYIICADGGIKYIYDMNVKIDGIIGDLDSVDDKFSKFVNENSIPIMKFPVEKDETDTELAIKYLSDKGCEYITLMGVMGSRMDHTLANIFLLKKLAEDNIKGKILDENNTIVLSEDYMRIERREDYYLSIIPLTTSGVRVSLKGFYYPLRNSFIEYGTTLGISNRVVDELGEIFITEGEALIIESRD